MFSDESRMHTLKSSLRKGTQGLIAVAIAVTMLVVGAVPAFASEFGEPVDYDLTLPVDGYHDFRDTFWDARSRGLHSSQDLFARKMVRVVATADGRVRLVNWGRSAELNPARCCSIVIDHDDGWQSTYIHLNNDTPGTDDGEGWGIADGIRPGVRVSAGQHIGWVGDSGSSENTTPHLHFELRDRSGILVNSFSALVAAGGNGQGGLDDPLFDNRRTLEQGLHGFDVRRLQTVLDTIGYDVGGIDGDFGPATKAAVVAFQDNNGLTGDGAVGRGTKNALKNALDNGGGGPAPDTTPSRQTVRKGDRGDSVRELQQELSTEGFDPGGVDGIFGPRTEVAVLDFQAHYSLTVDGIAGPQTWGALRPL